MREKPAPPAVYHPGCESGHPTLFEAMVHASYAPRLVAPREAGSGWYVPHGEQRYRFWDGERWTPFYAG